ncbi:MAG: enoyl-CoA hydratase-related protein [Lysobacteraceae bacterium]|nr:enoyl-CoA hydratase-related protein [Xanthomonadaceae bacterium]MCZ8318287.1 enoyl-CoA hydratase-related protein [Silanimonas sp.]
MNSPIDLQRRGGVAVLALARPDVHNAFDEGLIAALNAALDALAADDGVRALVLTGQGSTFSAGADLNWMRGMANASEAENLADSLELARLMRTLNFFPKPTIARVNGSAYGGGVGLVACCDIAIGVEGAKFSLSEAKLGLVPAVISPYVVAAIGARQARKLFQTAEVFEAPEAARIGLLHRCVPAAELDEAVDRELHWLGKGGPIAQKEAKTLALRMGGLTREDAERIDTENARLIARLRVSPEGQEGLSAFLDKRAPRWVTA